jgi:hypothetical protein
VPILNSGRQERIVFSVALLVSLVAGNRAIVASRTFSRAKVAARPSVGRDV